MCRNKALQASQPGMNNRSCLIHHRIAPAGGRSIGGELQKPIKLMPPVTFGQSGHLLTTNTNAISRELVIGRKEEKLTDETYNEMAKNLLARIALLEKQLNTAHADNRRAKKRIKELEEFKMEVMAERIEEGKKHE